MKIKLLVAILAIASFVTGCSKDGLSTIEKEETLYPVTFNVSTFSSSIGPIDSKKMSSQTSHTKLQTSSINMHGAGEGNYWLGNDISYLNYYVVDQDGKVVQYREFYHKTMSAENPEVPDPNFGIIKESLPAGTYQVLVIGSISSLNLSRPDNKSYISLYNHYATNDVFLQTTTIEVKSEPLNQSLVLARVVGKLEINLLDEIPADVERIDYSIANTTRSYYPLGANYLSTDPISKTVYTYSPNFKDDMFFYFFFDNRGITSGDAIVNIRAYGVEGNLIVNKTINNVPVGVNQKTILTGKLFEDPAANGQGFTVTVNTDWSSTNNIDF